MQNKIVIAALVIGLLIAACDNTKPQVDETRNDTTAVSEKPCIDSLLKGVVRASDMKLPILWTDTIYDTCQTHYSSDGKYIAFIGQTEEDLVRNSQYGIYGEDKEVLFNSVFLYLIESDSMFLVSTASPTIGALFDPKIDAKHGYLYYLRGDIYHSRGFYRYDINTRETDYLTGSHDDLTYSLKPNGNILAYNK